jgi:hypothetical protein
MAINDTEKLKSDNAQAINELNAIKAQMSSINPIDYQRLLGEINNLIASNMNIAPELLRSLESMRSTIENHEQNARTIQVSNNSNDRATWEDRNSRDSVNGFIDNEIREKELMVHKAEFQNFKEEFRQSLDDTNVLLKKVADGTELTKEEQNILNSPSSAEREKLSAQWKTTYQIQDKTNESIEYNQKQLTSIDKELEHPDTHLARKEQLMKSKAHHLSEVEKHQECLENDIKPCIHAREEQRQHLHKCVHDGKHEQVKHCLKAHCHDHIDHYKKEHCKDPNHKALHEMRDMIKKSGLHHDDKELQKHLVDIEKHIKANEPQKVYMQNPSGRSGALVPDKTPIVHNTASKDKTISIGAGKR